MTQAPAPEPIPARKLLGVREMKVRVALASALILVIGVVLAPRTTPPTGLAASPERAAPLIEEQVERREEVRPAVPDASILDDRSRVEFDLTSNYMHNRICPRSPAQVSRQGVPRPTAESVRRRLRRIFASEHDESR